MENKKGHDPKDGSRKHGQDPKDGSRKHGQDPKDGSRKHGQDPKDGSRKHGQEFKPNVQNVVFGGDINSQAQSKSADRESPKRPTSNHKNDKAGQTKNNSHQNQNGKANQTTKTSFKPTEGRSTNSKPSTKVNQTNTKSQAKTTRQSALAQTNSKPQGSSPRGSAGHMDLSGRGINKGTTVHSTATTVEQSPSAQTNSKPQGCSPRGGAGHMDLSGRGINKGTTVHSTATTVEQQSISAGQVNKCKTPKRKSFMKTFKEKFSKAPTPRQDTEDDVSNGLSSEKPDSRYNHSNDGDDDDGADDVLLSRRSDGHILKRSVSETSSTQLNRSFEKRHADVNKSASFHGASSTDCNGGERVSDDKLKSGTQNKFSSESGGRAMQQYENGQHNFGLEAGTGQTDLTQANFGPESGARPKNLTQANFGSESGTRPKDLIQTSNTLAGTTTNDSIPPYMEVRTSKESIVDLDVDVVVSSEDSTLHSGGLVAQVLAQSGGDLLDVSKDLIRKMCPNMRHWTFQPTPAYGKLKCKHIFHAMVPQYTTVSQTKWMDGFIFLISDILYRAEHFGYESIALPLIGTGRNGAPKDFVVDLMCQVIDEYAEKKRSNTCLQSVIIIHQDKTVKSSIDERIKGLKNCSQTRRQSSHRKAKQKTDVKTFFLKVKDRKTDTCPICMEEVSCSNLKQLSKCKHIFCKHCLEECFKRAPACPVCNMVYGEMIGTQPDGIMVEAFQRELHLPGYDDCGAIQLFYSFLGGKQTKEHPNPGCIYKGTKRNAYLPDNADGQRIHRLLRRAFQQRIVFTIGSSRTTGKEDVVTWNDIHHKTKTHGGPERYGYPDSDYLLRVLDELAAKGISED